VARIHHEYKYITHYGSALPQLAVVSLDLDIVLYCALANRTIPIVANNRAQAVFPL
jgi:hypothetical protein